MLSATTTEMITGQKSGEKFHILLKLKMGFFMWEKKENGRSDVVGTFGIFC